MIECVVFNDALLRTICDTKFETSTKEVYLHLLSKGSLNVSCWWRGAPNPILSCCEGTSNDRTERYDEGWLKQYCRGHIKTAVWGFSWSTFDEHSVKSRSERSLSSTKIWHYCLVMTSTLQRSFLSSVITSYGPVGNSRWGILFTVQFRDCDILM